MYPDAINVDELRVYFHVLINNSLSGLSRRNWSNRELTLHNSRRPGYHCRDRDKTAIAAFYDYQITSAESLILGVKYISAARNNDFCRVKATLIRELPYRVESKAHVREALKYLCFQAALSDPESIHTDRYHLNRPIMTQR